MYGEIMPFLDHKSNVTRAVQHTQLGLYGLETVKNGYEYIIFRVLTNNEFLLFSGMLLINKSPFKNSPTCAKLIKIGQLRRSVLVTIKMKYESVKI